MPENDVSDKLSICAACAAHFSCAADSGKCWCFALPPNPAALAAINRKFADCLCPDCLAGHYSREFAQPNNAVRVPD